MKPQRLTPVLLVLAVCMIGVTVLEWLGRVHEAHYEYIEVVEALASEDDGAEDDQSWQSTAPLNETHARARQLMRRGDVLEALQHYAEVSLRHVGSVPLMCEMAYVLRQADRCEEAAALAEQAVVLAPTDGAVQLSHALSQRCLGADAATRAAFEAAVAARPNHHVTRLAYGSYLRDVGELDAAIRVLEPASLAGSNEERARANALLGRCLFERGDRTPAIAAMADAIERAPSSVGIWLSVARTFVASDAEADLALALEHAERAVRLAPSSAPARSVLARSREKRGDRLGAIAAYRMAAQLDPTYVYVRERLVRLALDEEEFELASRVAGELLEIEPNNGEMHVLAGLAAAKRGEVDEARTAYLRAVEVSEGAASDAQYQLGLLERDAGRVDAARAAFEAAIAQAPSFDNAWNELGVVHFELEEYERAEAAFRQAIAIRPDFAAAWSNLGRSLAAHGAYMEAVGAYIRARDADPSDRVTRLRLAIAQRRSGDAPAAIATYQALVRDEPRYVSAWYNLGLTLAAEEREEEASRAFRNALAIDPEHRSSLISLGRLDVSAGRLEDAIARLSRALDQRPDDSALRVTLGEALRDAGDREACAREAALLVSQGANLEEARVLQRDCGVAVGD
jgi:tetratricopeptide (TPR) repeat protein